MEEDNIHRYVSSFLRDILHTTMLIEYDIIILIINATHYVISFNTADYLFFFLFDAIQSGYAKIISNTE